MATFKQKLFSLVYRKIAIHLPRTGTYFNIGTKIRIYLCRGIFKKCGTPVGIDKGVVFGYGYDVEIGNYSGFGINCNVPTDIKIGNYVMIGPNVHVMSRITHNFDDINTPMCEQGMKVISDRTVIGDDVWIGTDVLILGGKSIGSHSVIGARSVVSKDIPEYVVAAGNPIRIIRKRE